MRWALVTILGVAWASSSDRAAAQVTGQAPELDRVGVDERLGKMLPLDTEFRDHRGQRVLLREFFDGERPVVLNFAYHSCPVLCSMVLNATIDGLRQVPWTVGQEYRFVSISIDPEDTARSAAAKRRQLKDAYGRESGPLDDWTFLTGSEKDIQQVTQAVGFRYFYHEGQGEYAHPSTMQLVTPDGRMARYLYGLRFAPSDIRLGLLEAAEGRSTSTLEKVLIYCYRYDPVGGKYVLVATRVMQVGGGLVASLLGLTLFVLWRREFRQRRPLAPREEAV